MKQPMFSIGASYTIQKVKYSIMHREYGVRFPGQWGYYLIGGSRDYGWINEQMLSALSHQSADFCKGCIYLLNKPGKYCKKYSVFVHTCTQYRRD